MVLGQGFQSCTIALHALDYHNNSEEGNSTLSLSRQDSIVGHASLLILPYSMDNISISCLSMSCSGVHSALLNFTASRT